MIEQEETLKPKFTFHEDPFRVAEEIKGAQLIVANETFVIANTKGFSREDNERGGYEKVLEEEPGVMVGIPHRKAILPLITTINGGCILIKAVSIPKVEGKPEIIKGPGNVADRLGLKTGDTHAVIIEDPFNKVLRLK